MSAGKKIELVGGAWNGAVIEDLGGVTQKIGIYKDDYGRVCRGMPRVGDLSGYALYEPDAERRRSYWLENVWDGVCCGIVRQSDF